MTRDRVLAWLAAAAVTVWAAAAHADEVPLFDMSPACTKRSQSAADVAACVHQEDQLRLKLSMQWNVYPDYRKHFCVQELAFQPWNQRSYLQLIGCLDDRRVS